MVYSNTNTFKLQGVQVMILHIPYRTKVWWEKSLANLANFTKSPNFIHQTSSVLQLNYYFQYFNAFRQTLSAKLIFLDFRQTFLPPNFCPIW